MRINRKVLETPLVKGVEELKKMTEEEFLESHFYKEDGIDLEYFHKIKNSKSGYIRIIKTSDNQGYLRESESREGFTPILAEDFSCHVILDDIYEDYYYTSTIQKIHWDKGEFETKNSTYSFVFKEMSPEEYDKTVL